MPSRRPRPTFGARPPDSYRRVPHRRRIGIDWDRYESRLGKEPDADLAAEIGCTPTAVYKARTERSIGPYARSIMQVEHLVARFGRVLRTTTVALAFSSERCARRWLVGRPQLVGRGATRNRRWLAVPEGVDVDDVEGLPDELLDLLERTMAAERERDELAAGLEALAYSAPAVRVIGSGVAAEVVDELHDDLVEWIDAGLAAARGRDALLAGMIQIGETPALVRAEGVAGVVLPEGIDVDGLPDELLDLIERTMAAERERVALPLGGAAVRVIGAGVAAEVVIDLPAGIVELLDAGLAAERERDALLAGVTRIGEMASLVRAEGRAALAAAP